MGVHSGRYALVNGQSTQRMWSINDAHTPAEAVASNTAFGKTRRIGVREWNGNFGFFGWNPLAMPGNSISFSGYTAPENDSFGLGLIYSGTALISQLLVNWNWTGGELINAQADFVGHLALTEAQGAPPLDASTPVLEPVAAAANGGIQFQNITQGALSWTTLPNISTAALTITNAVQEYVNSSTVISGMLWKGRKPGIVDWNVSINQQDNARTYFNIGDQLALRMYVDASTFWLIGYVIVKDFTGIQINRETGAIIAQTIVLDMDGVNINTGALGFLTQPNGTLYWPLAQS